MLDSNNSFRSSMPDKREMRRLNSYQRAKAVVDGVEEAKAYLRSQRLAATNKAACLLVGISTGNHQESLDHVVAVERWGMSEEMPRDKVRERLKLLDPGMALIYRKERVVQETRADSDMMAEAVTNTLAGLMDMLKHLNRQELVGALTRFDDRRGRTLSTLLDLTRWLSDLEDDLKVKVRRT